MDNLKVHHRLSVRAWLSEKARREKIEFFHPPSYSPELNPDARLNRDLKGQFRSGPLAFTRGEIKRKVRSGMKIIQNNPLRVKKYFLDRGIANAA